MNLAQFFSITKFSAQNAATTKTKKTEAVAATLAPTTATPATTAKPTNQLPPTVMTAATSAVGYANGILYLQHDDTTFANNNSNIINNNRQHHPQQHAELPVNVEDHEETDSFGSMETLSDNVSIWVDGEKHWVSGVDANTTCADLINALVNYQDGQRMGDGNNDGDVDADNNNKSSNNSSNNNVGDNAINQSILNTKDAAAEAQENQQEQRDCVAGSSGSNAVKELAQRTCATDNNISSSSNNNNNHHHRNINGDDEDAIYVIVKQHRHCEEFLDGSTKVFDVLPTNREGLPPGRKENQLFLRRLTHSPHISTAAQLVGSLLSTDKDSGMGSPAGSSRSARFRRKKYKSTNWLAQGNTLHPKLSLRGSAANERLMKIILAQDETIHRQLTLLREKERQISKIEVENHRTRERELGKNYLLETYLNGLDEAVAGIDMVEGEEIFIDEPFHGYAATAAATTKTVATATTAKTRRHRRSKHSKDATPRSSSSSRKSSALTTAAAEDVVAAAVAPTDDTQQEIAEKIHWLEKLYALNKQLHREEEQLLKLHTKLRKQHSKRALLGKQQLQQQIDQVDDELALQCVDMRKAEDKLQMSGEQLQQKMELLERLKRELGNDEMATVVAAEAEEAEMLSAVKQQSLTATQISEAANVAVVDVASVTAATTPLTIASATTTTTSGATSLAATSLAATSLPVTSPTATSPLITATTIAPHTATTFVPATTFAATTATHTKLILDKMHSPEDLLILQKLIAKPQCCPPPSAATAVVAATIARTTSPTTTLPTSLAAVAATSSNYRLINHASPPSPLSTNNCCLDLLQLQQQHQQQQQLNDKNSLPLHASHIKTVNKQMFGPKSAVNAAAASATTATAVAATSTATHLTTGLPHTSLLPLNPLDFTQLGTLV